MDLTQLSKTHVTATEAAKLLGITKQAVSDLIAREKLTPLRIGRSVFIAKAEIRQRQKSLK